MINGLILVLAFVLLSIQTFLQHALAIQPWIDGQWVYPSLVLPLVLYMAVGNFSLERGASLAFVIGYLTDSFSSIPMGLFTFSMVAVFLLSRVAGLKLFLHGWVFQIVLTFWAAVASGVLIMGLHLVFERTNLAVGPAMRLLLAQSVVTAALSPGVFLLVRLLPNVEVAKPEEGNAA